MLHKYRKKVPIEAEQFDGSDEMKSKYGIGFLVYCSSYQCNIN